MNEYKYNDDEEALEEYLQYLFRDLDKSVYNHLTLSGNSYGFRACAWIAQNILQDWTILREVDFSNIFVSRTKEEIPPSLKLMMDAISDKKITKLALNDNAFGPQGIACFTEFLT